MRKIIVVSMLVALAVLLAACGGSAPVEEEHESSGDVKVAVASNPSPAVAGDIELLLTVTDKSGAPIAGAEVKVNAEHPAMAGMGMSGQAVEQGGGKYSIKANFSDSGDWMLTVSVHKDGIDHEEDIEFVVE